VALPAWGVHGEVYRPGEWLEALVLTESSGRPDVRRYEPHLDRKPNDPDTPGTDDGPNEDSASWGPMQVLGVNVRKILGASPGCLLNYTALYWWPLGLAFGLKILLGELQATERNVARSLARYNGGPTGDRLESDGRMRRQVYVDSVEAKAVLVREDRAARQWRYFGADIPGWEQVG